MSEIEVKVVKYPDRKNLVLRWIDPGNGQQEDQVGQDHQAPGSRADGRPD